MKSNSQANTLIKWVVIICDFILTNAILYFFTRFNPSIKLWEEDVVNIFFLGCNLAFLMSESRFYTVIHNRLATAGDILRRVLGLVSLFMLFSFLLFKIIGFEKPIGNLILLIGVVLFVVLIIFRLIERSIVNKYRKSGGNCRTVVLVGSDPELITVYDRLLRYPSKGFNVLGYYGDNEIEIPESMPGVPKLGTLKELIDNNDGLTLGDDMYVCLSRRDSDVVRKISKLCDDHVIRFYYVPVSVESMGLSLKRELLEDVEVFATYENPLTNPANMAVKRVFDIIMSLIALLIILPFLPFIALGIKIQSPKGSVFFKQPRHGLDGKKFYCYKFRSMHPNKDESGSKQATKDDPRKFPFGNFMRKTSVDELPQFWNVLKGDMSIVGPRPHPVVLNEKYKELVDKYMARHFVKPGVTGWAQVTGFRGETEELWQMEGRVKRDIWYIENWSFWLDIRILWMTIKQIIMHDEQAY